MNVKKRFLKIAALIFCTVAVLIGSVSNFVIQADDYLKNGNVRKGNDGEYILYDNYAKFDGMVYEYNLDEFFYNSELTVYTYTLSPADFKTGSVVVENNVLRIVPYEQMTEKIVITATGRGGETFETGFTFKFVDSVDYVTQKAVVMTVLAVILLLILLAVNFMVPINGTVRIKPANGNSNSIKYGKTGVAAVPSLKGWILGGNGKFIRFVAGKNKDVYVKNDNEVKKVTVIKIKPDDKMLWLYSDRECTDGIGIEFSVDI